MKGRINTPDSFHDLYIVDMESGCLIWQLAPNTSGYGVFSIGGHKHMAHRYAFELMGGKLEDDLELDHLCRNRLCVNPRHLEQVTTKTNLLRGDTIASERAAMTHCKRGHEFTVDNTGRRLNGCRYCRTCNRSRQQTQYAHVH